MKKFQINPEAKKAIYLGLLCTLSYLACYFARNILSVINPKLIADTGYTLEFIGTLGTTSMLTYAIGQLVNGTIGDFINAKYMISVGLFAAGIANFFIPFTNQEISFVILYGMSGFFLSMIYGPMTKVVAENTLPVYVTRCSLGFTVASLLGVPAASLAGMMFENWEYVFITCGILLMTMGVLCYLFFTYFEHKGVVKYGQVQRKNKKAIDVKLLIENSIIKFTLVAVLTGIVRTSVVFWIPTYISQYLGFSPNQASVIFTVITLVRSLAPYINNLLIYERLLKRNMNKTLIVMFFASGVSFFLMFAVKMPLFNLILLWLALMASGGASTMLWSVYCPSLRNTGMTSTATGFLDFMSYVAAAVANLLFANAVDGIGWKGLILVWSLLMFAGFVMFAIGGRKEQKKAVKSAE